jgi:hypothetical protein
MSGLDTMQFSLERIVITVYWTDLVRVIMVDAEVCRQVICIVQIALGRICDVVELKKGSCQSTRMYPKLVSRAGVNVSILQSKSR